MGRNCLFFFVLALSLHSLELNDFIFGMIAQNNPIEPYLLGCIHIKFYRSRIWMQGQSEKRKATKYIFLNQQSTTLHQQHPNLFSAPSAHSQKTLLLHHPWKFLLHREQNERHRSKCVQATELCKQSLISVSASNRNINISGHKDSSLLSPTKLNNLW